jgi:hypothetical protein
MKDMVVGAASGYDWAKISSWANSLDQCGFTGHKVILYYGWDQDFIRRATKRGYQVVGCSQREKTVHVDRFLKLALHLSTHNVVVNRVMITDTRDIIFQGNPSDWLDENLTGAQQLCAVTEGIRYQDEPWGSGNVLAGFGPIWLKQLADKVIVNAGCICGYQADMDRLFWALVQLASSAAIPLADQSALNVLLADPEWAQRIRIFEPDAGLCANLGTLAVDEFKPKLVSPQPTWDDKGVVFTSEGKPFILVHQYDRIPGLKEKIWNKYWEA